MNTITSTTRFLALGWEVAADIDRVTIAERDGETAYLHDSSALTIAAGWQSPGTVGYAFAYLASTGRVSLDALMNDINNTIPHAQTDEDRRALELLVKWAVNHPSLKSEDEKPADDRYREMDDKRHLICRECSTRTLVYTIPADERDDHDQAHDDGEFECEGHYDDDFTLTSGVGIGEATYCDGLCKP